MSNWRKFKVDEKNPGIIRGGPYDSQGGMLAGVHAQEICDRLNAYQQPGEASEPEEALVTEAMVNAAYNVLMQNHLVPAAVELALRAALKEQSNHE
jgi:hypothetical protein